MVPTAFISATHSTALSLCSQQSHCFSIPTPHFRSPSYCRSSRHQLKQQKTKVPTASCSENVNGKARSISKLALSLSVSMALAPTFVIAQDAYSNQERYPISTYETSEPVEILRSPFAHRHPAIVVNSTRIPESSPSEEDSDNITKTNTGIAIVSNSTLPTKGTSTSTHNHHKSLGDQLSRYLRRVGVSDAMIVFTLSSLPVLELRAGIPAGFVLGLSARDTFLLSVLGNLTPIFPLLLILRFSWVQSISQRILGRARTLAQSIGNGRSRALGLALFVGVPLPGTGAWTGALVAFVLGMPFAEALGALSGGVVMAATIMTTLCALGWIGASVAGLVLCVMGIAAIFRVCNTGGASKADVEDGSI